TPGPDPANTALAEVYQPPEGTFGPRGIDIGLDGVVWTALSSGHLGSFDRRRQAVSGRLARLSAAGPAIQGTRSQGQRQPLLLCVGRSLQCARPWRQRTDRRSAWP